MEGLTTIGHTFGGVRVQRVQRVQKVQKVLPAFGRRVQRVWWRLAPQILKKGARLCRGLCRRVASLRSGGDSACGAEGSGLP